MDEYENAVNDWFTQEDICVVFIVKIELVFVAFHRSVWLNVTFDQGNEKFPLYEETLYANKKTPVTYPVAL